MTSHNAEYVDTWNCLQGYPTHNRHNNCPYSLMCAVCDIDAEERGFHRCQGCGEWRICERYCSDCWRSGNAIPLSHIGRSEL